MADIGSTATALAMLVASLIYPPGGVGILAQSVTGNRTIVRRGWPVNADLSGPCGINSGVDLVTVMPRPGVFRQMSEPLGWPWELVSSTPSTVALSVSGNTVTVSIAAGAVPSGVVGMTLRAAAGSDAQDNAALSYTVQGSDTPATIAAALAAQVPDGEASGAVVTFPSARLVTPVVSGTVTARQVTRRQMQEFVVSVWSGDWQRRDALGLALDQAMAAQNWIANLDGTQSLVVGAGVDDNDAAQNAGVFRRDLRFRVTYDSVQTQTGPSMMFGIGMTQIVTAAGVVLEPFGQTAPVAGVATDGNGDIYIDAAGNLVATVQNPAYPGVGINSSGYITGPGA